MLVTVIVTISSSSGAILTAGILIRFEKKKKKVTEDMKNNHKDTCVSIGGIHAVRSRKQTV